MIDNKIPAATLRAARQWAADIDADRQTISQDTIDAAADLINGLPDVWVSGDRLREVIDRWTVEPLTSETGSEMIRQLEDLLPAPAPRAEITFGGWAIHPEHGKVLIVSTRADMDGKVEVAHEHSAYAYGVGSQWVPADTLTAIPDEELESVSEPANDETLAANGGPNLTKEPQPGEAWEVDADDYGVVNAIRGEDSWTFDRGTFPGRLYPAFRPLRRLVPETTAQAPRPEECCGECPEIVGGGYDCTCADNPRCPNYQGPITSTEPQSPAGDAWLVEFEGHQCYGLRDWEEAIRTIVACGDVLDRLRQEVAKLDNEQPTFEDDGTVYTSIAFETASQWLAEALGETN